jgi:hypothetical protein
MHLPYARYDFLSRKPQVNALNVQGRCLGTNGGNLEFATISPLDAAPRALGFFQLAPSVSWINADLWVSLVTTAITMEVSMTVEVAMALQLYYGLPAWATRGASRLISIRSAQS